MRLRRPSHATVIAYLALFVALGGTSYAAIRVTGRNVVDGSLELRDLSRKARAQLRGASVSGPAGHDGAAGRNGAPGENGGPGRDGTPGKDGATGRDGADAAALVPTHVIDVDLKGSPLERGEALRDRLNTFRQNGDYDEYLVRLGPGTYDLGTTQLEPPGNVDLQGAGPSLTKLDFGTDYQGNAAIFLTDNNEFRDLSINIGGGRSAIDVNGVRARLERVWVTRSEYEPILPVLAKAGNATLIDSVVHIADPYGATAVDASWPHSSSRSITGTRIDVAGDNAIGLVLGGGSQTTITNSDITASGLNARAVMATAEPLNFTNLVVRSSHLSAAVAVQLNGDAHLFAGASQIDGPVTRDAGATARCANSWDSAFAELDATCD